jgi:hypothetical protein
VKAISVVDYELINEKEFVTHFIKLVFEKPHFILKPEIVKPTVSLFNRTIIL